MKLEKSYAEKDDVEVTKEIGHAAGLGFSVNVFKFASLQYCGGHESRTSHKREIEKVVEKIFRPSRLYVQQSLFQPDVLRKLVSEIGINDCRCQNRSQRKNYSHKKGAKLAST